MDAPALLRQAAMRAVSGFDPRVGATCLASLLVLAGAVQTPGLSQLLGRGRSDRWAGPSRSARPPPHRHRVVDRTTLTS